MKIDRESTRDPLGEADGAAAKRPYSKPALYEHGSVLAITQGNGHSKNDFMALTPLAGT